MYTQVAGKSNSLFFYRHNKQIKVSVGSAYLISTVSCFSRGQTTTLEGTDNEGGEGAHGLTNVKAVRPIAMAAVT